MKNHLLLIILILTTVPTLEAKSKKVLIFVDVTLRIHEEAVRTNLENVVSDYIDNLKVRGYRHVQVIIFPINAYTLTSSPIISADFTGRSDAINRGKRMRAIQSIKDALSESLNTIEMESKQRNKSDLLSIIRRASAVFENDEIEKELAVFSDFFQFSSELKLLPELQHVEPQGLVNKLCANNGWDNELQNVRVTLCTPFPLPIPVESVLRLQTFWIGLYRKQGAEASFETQ